MDGWLTNGTGAAFEMGPPPHRRTRVREEVTALVVVYAKGSRLRTAKEFRLHFR